jgi:hypothetical protein
MENTHTTLVSKIETASFSLPPSFRAVLECMLAMEPRRTLPEFSEVAITRNGKILGYTTCWHEVLESYYDENGREQFKALSRFRLIEMLLDFCQRLNLAPQERFYLLELIKAMDEDGKAI